MRYDFDKIIDRTNTNCVKYDLRNNVFGNPDLIPMWVADMDFETPEFVRNAVIERANHPIYGYTFRDDAYFESIVNWLERHHSWKIQKDWITFSPGIVAALNMIVLAFTKPNDKIMIQPPVYFPFFTAAKNHDRELVFNNLKKEEKGYVMDYELLEKQAQDAKMIILSNPHNPVGRSWSKEELERVAAICLKNNVMIVSDEIHCDLVLPPHKHTVTAGINDEIASHTITLHAASKTFNLAGLATSSVIISNDEWKKQFKQFIENLHVDLGNLFGKTATQTAFEKGDEWLRQLLIYINRNMDEVCYFLANELPRIKVFRPEATYMLWLDFNDYKLNDDELKKVLVEEAGLGFNSGIEFGQGGEGFVRMNVACPLSVVKESLKRLKKSFA